MEQNVAEQVLQRDERRATTGEHRDVLLVVEEERDREPLREQHEVIRLGVRATAREEIGVGDLVERAKPFRSGNQPEPRRPGFGAVVCLRGERVPRRRKMRRGDPEASHCVVARSFRRSHRRFSATRLSIARATAPRASLRSMPAVLAGCQAVAECLSGPFVEEAALVEAPVVVEYVPGELGVAHDDGLDRADPDLHHFSVGRQRSAECQRVTVGELTSHVVDLPDESG
ncbi:MAG: hypothetical protein WBA97_10385 [Actinophytocola sp.]|uniref:hypothetical protein n=1 Tax=Actinophytocola sp. TaxID=1872138 RepID=UPI003C7542F6